MSTEQPPLSPEGLRRRAEILRLAERALDRRVRKRRWRRAAIATGGVAATVLVVLLVRPGAEPATPTGPHLVDLPPESPADGPLDLRALAALPLPYSFEVIDDAGLRRELEFFDVGLVQVGSAPPRLVAADGSPITFPLSRQLAEPAS